MKRINSKLTEYLPFIVLFALMAVIHSFLSVTWGDDGLFRYLIGSDDYNLFESLGLRYTSWTSRVLIEAVLFSILNHVWLWRILNLLFCSSIPLFISLILKCDKKTNWIICFFALVFPFCVFGEAGWIATTVNYIWPIWCCLFTVFVLSRYVRSDGHINPVWYVLSVLTMLFAANAEQCSIMLFVMLALFIIQLFTENKKKLLSFPIILLILDIASMIFIYTCPGNSIRTGVDSVNWFPGFESVGIIDKTLIGIANSFRIVVSSCDFFTVSLLLALVLLVYRSKRKNFEVIFPLIPLFMKLGFIVTGRFNENFVFTGIDNSNLRIGVLSYIFPTMENVYSRNEMTGSFALTIIYYFVFLACVLISIYLIWRDDIKRAVFYMVFLLAGFGSLAILGFSPTVYASGTRTGTYCFGAFAFVLVTSYIHIENVDSSSEKSAQKKADYNPLIICLCVFLVIMNWVCSLYNIIPLTLFS